MRAGVVLASLIGTMMLGAASAQNLDVPAAASTSVERPARGLTMEKVEARYGAPAQRVPAVGQPPITRWEYPGFVVYFEHQYVLHTVAR